MTCRPPGELFGRTNELARLHTSLDDAMTASAGAPPYWLWRPALDAPNPLDSLADPAALAERIADRVREAAGERGVVILIDDLHLADGPSLGTLVDVMRLLRQGRVLVCAAHDDARARPARGKAAARCVG